MKYQAISDKDIIDGLNVKYLKMFGLWKVINDYRATGKRNAILKFEVGLITLLVIIYSICQFMSFFNIQFDVQKFTFLNLYTLPGFQAVFKILVFWFRIEDQCKMYNLVRKDFLKIPSHKEAHVKRIYENISAKSNMFCNAAILINTSTVILWILYPGLPVDYILYNIGSTDVVRTGRNKILGGWYPMPMGETPYYEIIFVFEAVMIIIGGLNLAVYICQFFQVLMCLYAQFAVLGYHLSTLKFNAVDGDDRIEDSENNAMYKELNEILEDHQKLLSYANELKSVYNPLVTVILGMGLLVLIFSVFQFLFGSLGNMMFLFTSLQTLTFQAVEVGMFCFGSQFLETASSELQLAAYSSDWYKADIKFKRAVQMMMVRAKKGETLSAVRMYPVNVETLMAMIQFTYSMITLLSRMTE
ncbi:odorant receptor 10-like [Halyomorpha halys]|uniref:odorant receptor 10-like n=1 Tax=Halyomorpha halys TaxID=286706 RepID=UPI0034D2AFF8|nr:Odorant receptor 36 [Halyomorpha halys]